MTKILWQPMTVLPDFKAITYHKLLQSKLINEQETIRPTIILVATLSPSFEVDEQKFDIVLLPYHLDAFIELHIKHYIENDLIRLNISGISLNKNLYLLEKMFFISKHLSVINLGKNVSYSVLNMLKSCPLNELSFDVCNMNTASTNSFESKLLTCFVGIDSKYISNSNKLLTKIQQIITNWSTYSNNLKEIKNGNQLLIRLEKKLTGYSFPDAKDLEKMHLFSHLTKLLIKNSREEANPLSNSLMALFLLFFPKLQYLQSPVYNISHTVILFSNLIAFMPNFSGLALKSANFSVIHDVGNVKKLLPNVVDLYLVDMEFTLPSLPKFVEQYSSVRYLCNRVTLLKLFHNYLSKRDLILIFNNMTVLNELNLSFCGLFIFDITNNELRCHKRLKNLTIQCYSSGDYINAILPKVPNLEQITLGVPLKRGQYCHLCSYQRFIIENLKDKFQLRQINLNVCYYFRIQGLDCLNCLKISQMPVELYIPETSMNKRKHKFLKQSGYTVFVT